MAGDENGRKVGGKLKIIRLMKEWLAECNPGLQTSIGEYNFGGEKDISGGVAQAELLGVFAREGLDFAFLWFFPTPNSSHWFAYKLYRNPDGKFTAFGDKYLPATVNAPTDVSVHAARDRKSGKITLVLINKRAAKDASVTLKFNQPLPDQEVVPYEYSAADRMAIGQLPPVKIGGSAVTMALPAMSVMRFDVKP
jgi:hypothetical protein